MNIRYSFYKRNGEVMVKERFFPFFSFFFFLPNQEHALTTGKEELEDSYLAGLK